MKVVRGQYTKDSSQSSTFPGCLIYRISAFHAGNSGGVKCLVAVDKWNESEWQVGKTQRWAEPGGKETGREIGEWKEME